jgi:hypothetical protein
MPDFVGHGVIMRFGKMLVGLVALFVMLFSAGQALARQVVPVVDFVDVPVVTTSGHSVTAQQVRDVIIAAATGRQWSIAKSPSENLLTATLEVRGKHTVVVVMTYSEKAYSIKYQGSTNMKYAVMSEINGVMRDDPRGMKMIHPFYNRWVQDLNDTIRLELKKL